MLKGLTSPLGGEVWRNFCGGASVLLFKKKFIESIRAGTKTQTIRLWRVLRYRTGQRSYIPGVGYIRIEALDAVTLDELTDADAVPDGFESAAALRAEIETLYADTANHGATAYRLCFRVLPEEEQAAARAEKSLRQSRVK